jgi:hypothetical protein
MNSFYKIRVTKSSAISTAGARRSRRTPEGGWIQVAEIPR